MTVPQVPRWPAVPVQRRTVIESRTVTGEACTIVVERRPDGPLLVGFHGPRHTPVAPSREEVTMLLTALADAAR